MLTTSAGSSERKEANKVTILKINFSQIYGTLCRTFQIRCFSSKLVVIYFQISCYLSSKLVIYFQISYLLPN